jgi:peptide/nickel transport system permease protein
MQVTASPEPLADPFEAEGAPVGYWREAFGELRRDRVAMGGLVVCIVILAAAVFAMWIRPHDPNAQFNSGLTAMGDPRPPGSHGFLLGTDAVGRDELSRVLTGAGISLIVGIGANLISAIIGLTVGGIAGLAGGGLQTGLMRAVDVVVSFPVLLLAITLLSVVSRPTVTWIMIIIGINFGAYLARLVYGQVVSLKEREFVVAARASGSRAPFILVRHLLPHVLPSVIVYATLGVATAIQLEAALAFVGLGIPPPAASWGNMISDGEPYLFTAPWLVIIPGAAIFIAMMAFSLLGDGLRDALDPTLERRSLRDMIGVR